jgi:hypothetical protein
MSKKADVQFLKKNSDKRDFVKKGELLLSFLKTCSYMLTNNTGLIKEGCGRLWIFGGSCFMN